MIKAVINSLLSVIFPQSSIEEGLEHITIADLNAYLSIKTNHQITSLLPYREPLIRHLVQLAKFKNNKTATTLMGQILGDYLLEEISDGILFSTPNQSIILVPIPLSRQRQRARGFNQSERICQAAQAELGGQIEIANLLTRPHHRIPQTKTTSRRERLANIKGAFSLNEKVAKNISRQATIIVIDDVTTTGATLREALMVLQQNSFTNSTAIAIAH